MTTALAFAQVSKKFIIQHERPQSLQERFVQLLRPRPTSEEFWALRDVSFTVEAGETFGILGRNGAGKSTLLKLATGILKPTSGRIQKDRRAYAMLELGAGFHPELSGRDNIFLNGSIHGLSRPRMQALFDEIVAFAELERFIDTPVKHYSSGMFMRLGFATAIHMQPELLIIDEILAVGDAAFRRKCTEALWNLKRQGVTIVFVSHNQEAVYQFCDRALLLDGGTVAAIGAVDEVASAYTAISEAEVAAAAANRPNRPRVHAIALLDARGQETLSLASQAPWALETVVSLPPGRVRLSGEVMLRTETGTPVVVAHFDESVGLHEPRVRHLRAAFAPVPLQAGRLRAGVRLALAAGGDEMVMVEYDSPQSVTIAGREHGPLLTPAYRWLDPADPADLIAPRPAVGAAEWAPRDGTVAAPRNGRSEPSENGAADGRAPSSTRYLAEGSTGDGFETCLALANPTADTCHVAVTVHAADAATAVAGLPVTLLPGERRVIDLVEIVGRNREFSLRLAGAGPFLAERFVAFERYPALTGMTYGRPEASTLPPFAGGHLGVAADAPSSRWYFAEGYTGAGFDAYFAIYNPAPDEAAVAITYYLADGGSIVRDLTIAAHGRRTVVIHDPLDAGGIGPGQIFSALVSTPADQPVVVEHVRYFRYRGAGFVAAGATASLGATMPATTWFFAAGSTEVGHDEYLTLLNPSLTAGAATLTYYLSDGAAPVARTIPLAPRGRATIAVHEEQSAANPGGLGRGYRHGLAITSSVPIVAERPIYFHHDAGPLAGVSGGSCAAGSIGTLAEGGRVLIAAGAGLPDERAALAIVNPDAGPASLTITVHTPHGLPTAHQVAVPALAQATVALAALIPPANESRSPHGWAWLTVAVDRAGPAGVAIERVLSFRAGRAGGGAAATVARDLEPAPVGAS